MPLSVKHLDAVVDIAIAEMATRQPRTFNEVTLSGLDSLKRTTCQLKGDVYTCLAVAEKAVVNSPEHKNLKVVVKIPIGVQVNGDVFQKFIIGEVEVEEADEVITEDGLFGFWKKVKKAVGKAGKAVVKGAKKVVKTAAQIALEEAKNVAHQKANVSFTLFTNFETDFLNEKLNFYLPGPGKQSHRSHSRQGHHWLRRRRSRS